MIYERKILSVEENRVETDGRIVEVLSAPQRGRSQITALVEVSEAGSDETAASDDSEGVTDPTCATDKTDCSRSVGKAGEVCWQHED